MGIFPGLRMTAAATSALLGVLTMAAAPAVASTPQVVGGQPSPISAHPWQVIVIGGESELCSGSLLTPTIVLTAAHCAIGLTADQMEVFAGLTTVSQRSPGDALQVSAITRNPGFIPAPTYANDLALLTLATPVPASTGARTIALPVGVDAGWPASGTPATISGWGVTSPGSSQSSDQLLAGTVTVLAGPGQPCGQYGGAFDPSTTICAGLPDGTVDTCQGDSGGPLVIDVAGKPILAGSVVGGSACADASLPGVYTRLTAYLPWIRSTGLDVDAAAAAAGQPLTPSGTPTSTGPSAKVGAKITAAKAAGWAGLSAKGAKVTAKRSAACRQSGSRILATAPGTCTISVSQGSRKRTVRVSVTR